VDYLGTDGEKLYKGRNHCNVPHTAGFGSNAYGIKVAAETYFNKSTDSLNIQESCRIGWYVAGYNTFQSRVKS
jgi:hypothetical protein